MKLPERFRIILPLALVGILSVTSAIPVLADDPGGDHEVGQRTTAASGGSPPSARNSSPSARREIVVELRKGETIQAINEQFGTTTIERMSGTSIYLLAPPARRSVEEIANDLNHHPTVAYAEPNNPFKDPSAQQFDLAFDGQYSFAVPNDEAQVMYKRQWDVYKTRLPEAQALATGRGVVVAVIDTGVAMTHTALVGRFTQTKWDFVDDDFDPADLPNGLDDDGDGYSDEAAGHGTFIAGIIALVAPEASIMPIRVLDSDGWGTSYDVAAAIRFAVDLGAKVVNVSLGMAHNSRAVQDAVDYAYSMDAVLVASVGNRSATDRSGNILYPARLSNAVAVVATDSDDLKASFSAWGKEADISAPGATVYSTYWNGGYAYWSGTSMAAAFVSGGAALVKGLHPTWTRNAVVDRLTSTAVGIDGLNHNQYWGKLGAGRIDFYSAVK